MTADSKYDVVAALPVPVAYALREHRGALRPPALAPLALAAVTAAAVFVLTTPAVLFDTGGDDLGPEGGARALLDRPPGGPGGAVGFYISALMHDQVLLLPGAAVAVIAAWYGRFRRETIVVGAFALGYFALIASQAVRFDRDLLSLLPALILLTALAAAWLVEVAERAAVRRTVPARERGLGQAITVCIGVLVLTPRSSAHVPFPTRSTRPREPGPRPGSPRMCLRDLRLRTRTTDRGSMPAGTGPPVSRTSWR